MNKTSINYLSIFLIFALYSCSNSYKYPADTSISQPNGSPIDSINISYILDSIDFDGKEYIYQWNINTKNELNKTLKNSGSPILFNYFLNRDIVRVVTLNADSTSIIDISKDKTRSWLTYKLMVKHNDTIDTDSIGRIDSESLNVNFRTINLDSEQWKVIDSLAQIVVFEDMQNITRNSSPILAPSYFIEYHTKDQYFYCFSDNKNQQLQDFIKYLTSLGHFIKM